jgi:hypothetical protein
MHPDVRLAYQIMQIDPPPPPKTDTPKRIAGLLAEPDQTWPEPPLPQWGVKPTRLNLSSSRHLRWAMLPKFST